jgi:hypothetical protein
MHLAVFTCCNNLVQVLPGYCSIDNCSVCFVPSLQNFGFNYNSTFLFCYATPATIVSQTKSAVTARYRLKIDKRNLCTSPFSTSNFKNSSTIDLYRSSCSAAEPHELSARWTGSPFARHCNKNQRAAPNCAYLGNLFCSLDNFIGNAGLLCTKCSKTCCSNSWC